MTPQNKASLELTEMLVSPFQVKGFAKSYFCLLYLNNPMPARVIKKVI